METFSQTLQENVVLAFLITLILFVVLFGVIIFKISVVAAEIRQLAERSQAASNQIEEVSNAGLKVAQNSREPLDAVVPEIQKTSDLVKEISAASTEQNRASDHINEAIRLLNQIVQ